MVRRARVLITVAVLLASASAFLQGGPGALVACLIACGAVALAARALADPGERDLVLSIAVIALGARVVAAMALHAYLLPTNGALFNDDAGYINAATHLAESWQRGVTATLDPSEDNEYVTLAGALFYAFGPNVALLKIVNCAFGVGAALLVYRTVRVTRGGAPLLALGAMLVFPSLVLWSALALKDTYTLFFMMAAIWGVAEFVHSGRWPWYAVTFASIALLAEARNWLFFILLAAWPLGVLLGARERRWRGAAVAALASLTLLATTDAVSRLAPNMITLPGYIRGAMAAGARTGFVEGQPAYAVPGAFFAIQVPGRTPVPDPRVSLVAAGTELIVVDSLPPPDASQQPSRRPTAFVRSGDIVAIRVPGAPPPLAAGASPPPATRAIVINPPSTLVITTPPPVRVEDQVSISQSIAENAAYLPFGLLVVLSAPVPFLWTTPRDALTLVEIVPWYLALVLAAIAVWAMWRRRAVPNAYGVLVGLGILVVLGLVEGNIGTLMRHRAMLIPHVLMLAALGAGTVWPRLRARIS